MRQRRKQAESIATQSVLFPPVIFLAGGSFATGRKSMKERKRFCGIFPIICLLFLNTCATTQFNSVWKDETYQGGPLKEVLIIGVAKKPAVRTYFEETFAQQLQARGVDAIPSNVVLPGSEMLKKETIISKINELKIDSVLVTKLVDVKDVGTYETSPASVSGTGYYGYYSRGYQSVSLGRNIVLITRIFDAKSEKLLWSALSETVLEGSPESVLDSFIPAIMQQMEEGNLIPKIGS
jgi:hypothetical protein